MRRLGLVLALVALPAFAAPTNDLVPAGAHHVKITAKASTTVWSGGKGTSVVTTISENAGPKVNKCPKGATLLLTVGKITGGTGAALKAMPKGQAVTTDVCVAKNDTSSLEPGTVAKY